MSKAFFKDVIGNGALCERIGKEILSGSLSHAYLLEGQRGFGKHLLATRIAMALKERGLAIDPAVYTVQDLEEQLLALRKGGAAC